jgi:hypothetical protein
MKKLILSIFACIVMFINMTKIFAAQKLLIPWYHACSQEDQNKYKFEDIAKRVGKYSDSDLVKALVKDQRFDLLEAAINNKFITDDDCIDQLFKHKHSDIVYQWLYDGILDNKSYKLISCLLEYNNWDFLYRLIKDGTILKTDAICSAITIGCPSQVETMLAMELSDEEMKKIAEFIPLYQIMGDNKDLQYQALAIFVQKLKNKETVDQLFATVYDNYFCGQILHSIKPEFVQQELARCKTLLALDSELSVEQKSSITNLYASIIFEKDRTLVPCSLPIAQMHELQDLHLNVWQLVKYFPNSLFETKQLLSSEQSTLTHFMLINYLNNQQFRDDIFEKKSSSPEGILYKKGVYDKLLKIEHAMSLEGYTTFIHGRRWNFNFVEDMKNLLQALGSDQKSLPELTVMPWQHSSKIIEDLRKQRNAIIKNGSSGKCDGACYNSSILSNNEYGSYAPLYSAHYFAHNCNSSSNDRDAVQDIFASAGKSHIFDRYKDDLQDLEKSHADCSQTGELVVTSIKNELVSDLMYVAGLQAKKKVDDPAMQQWCKELMCAYEARTNYISGDYFYFALPDIPGERERGDYIIQSVHGADPEKYALYREKLQKLFELIKNDRATVGN